MSVPYPKPRLLGAARQLHLSACEHPSVGLFKGPIGQHPNCGDEKRTRPAQCYDWSGSNYLGGYLKRG